LSHKCGIAFIFPGQGSQYVGMGQQFVDLYPDLKEAFDEAKSVTGIDYLDLCLSGPEEVLNETRNTQLCIYILSYGIYKLIERSGLKPQVVAGHSLGEYSALTAAKTFKFSDGLRIVAKRADLMSEAGRNQPGKMLAVLGADMRAVDDVVSDLSGKGVISVANYNCPGQIVVSLDSSLIDLATGALQRAGAKKVVLLPVSGAFHSVMMKDAEDKFVDFLNSQVFLTAEVPVVPNTLAKPVVDAKEIKNALQTQMSTSVKWQQSVQQMIGLGIKTFIEVGPGQVLSKIIKRIDKQVDVMSTDKPDLLSKVIDKFSEV